MKLLFKSLLIIGLAGFAFQGCQKDSTIDTAQVDQSVIDRLIEMGFNPDGIVIVPQGYRIENDIIIRPEDLARNVGVSVNIKDTKKQYSTNNLVTTNGGRVITIYAAEESTVRGKKTPGYSVGMIAGLDEAIRRYNALPIDISFQRVTSSGADIVMTRLSKGEERQGILGSAGFPTASGDPYGEIKMSGILESSYGLGTDGIATIIAHEMGHCIGFRHTDYFDRSISCGGGTSNEGVGTIGANHIPGTPTGADLSGNGSWMLSCTDGSDRPFTGADQTALNYLY